MKDSLVAVVLGVVVAFVLIMAIEILGSTLFPPPAGVDVMDEASLSAALEAGQIPLGAMLFVLLAYLVGSFAGGGVAARIARRNPMGHALVVGGILLVMGIGNLVSIPHPLWMAIATLVIFLPAAWLGGRVLGKANPAEVAAGA